MSLEMTTSSTFHKKVIYEKILEKIAPINIIDARQTNPCRFTEFNDELSLKLYIWKLTTTQHMNIPVVIMATGPTLAK